MLETDFRPNLKQKRPEAECFRSERELLAGAGTDQAKQTLHICRAQRPPKFTFQVIGCLRPSAIAGSSARTCCTMQLVSGASVLHTASSCFLTSVTNFLIMSPDAAVRLATLSATAADSSLNGKMHSNSPTSAARASASTPSADGTATRDAGAACSRSAVLFLDGMLRSRSVEGRSLLPSTLRKIRWNT